MMEANKALWNVRTGLHTVSRFYDLEAFKAGECSLRATELQALGDVRGKSLLHLQCHFGQDSLSWARRGAVVTGLDFSEKAIETARQLAEELGLPAQFVCANVLGAEQVLGARYDIVFTSYGVVGWLPDLDAWARTIAACLAPGGRFFMVEFHPVFQMLDHEGKLQYSYFPQSGPDHELMEKTYADGLPHAPMDEYWWPHSLADLFSALRKAGLHTADFREYDFSAYCLHEDMVERAPQQWQHKKVGGRIPYMFSLMAEPS